MLESLQIKQRRLLANIKTTFIRKEFDFLNSNERLIAIIGSRGVGKTTLLLQYLSQFSLNEALYISADDIEVANYGIIPIVEEFYSLGGRIVVIDEVHMFKEWALHIKNIYDFMPDMKIRISGSSMLNILMQSYDLSRRIIIKELDKLSFKEYFELKNSVKLKSFSLNEILENSSNISFELIQKYPFIYREFKEYLKMGAYPYFIESENFEMYSSKLLNSIEKIIYEDIPSVNKIKFDNLIVFKKLIFKLVESKVPYQVKVDSLAKELKISEPTLYTYFEILDKTGIFLPIYKYSKKQTKKPSKIFFKNTNILYVLAQNLHTSIEIGTIRETFFVNCFKKINYSDIGDFIVDEKYIFEIGGKNKSFSQIKDVKNSFLALDVDSTINNKKIPLWLFGLVK